LSDKNEIGWTWISYIFWCNIFIKSISKVIMDHLNWDQSNFDIFNLISKNHKDNWGNKKKTKGNSFEKSFKLQPRYYCISRINYRLTSNLHYQNENFWELVDDTLRFLRLTMTVHYQLNITSPRTQKVHFKENEFLENFGKLTSKILKQNLKRLKRNIESHSIVKIEQDKWK
jgi:hypothetical protein